MPGPPAFRVCASVFRERSGVGFGFRGLHFRDQGSGVRVSGTEDLTVCKTGVGNTSFHVNTSCQIVGGTEVAPFSRQNLMEGRAPAMRALLVMICEEGGARLRPSSSLLGLTDNAQVGSPGVRHKFFNLGAGRSPSSPN